jgi:hypothetical protein
MNGTCFQLLFAVINAERPMTDDDLTSIDHVVVGKRTVRKTMERLRGAGWVQLQASGYVPGPLCFGTRLGVMDQQSDLGPA